MTQRPSAEWLTRWEYAHRGLHSAETGGSIPENSPAAFDAAVAAAMGIECDIQLSRDGVPMVMHDWELHRLTGRDGAHADFDADHIETLTLLGTEQRPYRLAKLLQAVSAKVPILIEIKSLPLYAVERSCAAVSAVLQGYQGEVAVMSFDPRVGAWFAKHDSELPRGLVCTDTLDHGFLSAWRAPGALEQASPDFLAVDVRDLPNSICDLWRESGKPLLSWTVRSQELRAHALRNVDALISEGAGLP